MGVQWATPDLQVLVDLFYEDSETLGRFQEIGPGDMPERYRRLLAHHDHMTVTMEAYHRSLVDVEVLATHTTATHYSRCISLSRQSDGTVVQFGIVRLNRALLGEDVYQEIASEQEPLGRILIRADVLRNVKLLSLWRVEPGPELRKVLGRDGLSQCYGRTALIYCNGMPAVELLEIVVLSDDDVTSESSTA